ncbi:hypothetical protein ACVI55_004395 [Sinorhizobium medicae]
MQLSMIFQILNRHPVAGEMQQRIGQHRTMPVRLNETVTVDPSRIDRIVPEKIVPKHLGNIRHAHCGPGMAGIGLLHDVDSQETNCVRQFTAVEHVQASRFSLHPIMLSLQHDKNDF